MLTDAELERKISDLKTQIESWAIKHDIWSDAGFKTYDEHFDDQPLDEPYVLVLWYEGGLFNLFNGYTQNDIIRDEFEELVDATDFMYEFYDHMTMVFSAKDEKLNEEYRRYFSFKWVCKLVTPDFSQIYEELFEHFAKHPEDLYKLEWRGFEQLIESVFRNYGYRTELGPGQGDRGIDLRLYQKDAIGEVVTLVQAKRYKKIYKIGLETVAALESLVTDENANRGLLVTTSEFLPGARAFAERKNRRIQLATSQDVKSWCEEISRKLQKFSPVDTAVDIINQLRAGTNLSGFLGKIVHTRWGYNMIINDFCLIIKETEQAALLVKLPKRVVSDDGDGFTGYEVPFLPENFELGPIDSVIRAKKSYDPKGEVSFWGDKKFYDIWDGEPKYFDWLD